MKKYVFVVLAVALTIYMTGCGKKQQTLEELQEPMSMDISGKLPMESQPQVMSVVPEAPAPSPEQQMMAAQPPVKLEPLPPSGPFKPSPQDIQTALKNAGYYTGLVDGKIGPMSKKAIEEFQKANNLKVDGKVGPMTWEALSKHLNPEPVMSPVPITPGKKKR